MAKKMAKNGKKWPKRGQYGLKWFEKWSKCGRKLLSTKYRRSYLDFALKLSFFFCFLGPDAEVYCQSCYSFEFGTKSRTKPKNKAQFKRSFIHSRF